MNVEVTPLLKMVVGRKNCLEQCCILLVLITFCTESGCQAVISSNESTPITQFSTYIGNLSQKTSLTKTMGTIRAQNSGLLTNVTSPAKTTFEKKQSFASNSTGDRKHLHFASASFNLDLPFRCLMNGYF